MHKTEIIQLQEKLYSEIYLGNVQWVSLQFITGHNTHTPRGNLQSPIQVAACFWEETHTYSNQGF